MPEREAIGCPGVVCERPLAAAGSRLQPIGRVLEDGQGRGTARPGWAEPGRTEREIPPRAHPSPKPGRGPAATMRWLRALLKNASLAGAPKYIEHFSKFSPSPLSMKQFLDFGTDWAGGAGPRGGLGGADGGVLAKEGARGRERP